MRVDSRGATRASGGGGTATATASSATVLATPTAVKATSLWITSTAMRVVASPPSSERRSSGDQRTYKSGSETVPSARCAISAIPPDGAAVFHETTARVD